MLEGIVRRLLVDRFGRFVHGVDDARLSSGLTSGQLSMANLRLKDAAAEILGLAPAFDLRHGTIGRMRVDLPGITSFSSKPVTVKIEDVFLLLVAATSDAQKVNMHNQAKSKARAKKMHEIETAMSNILLELGGMVAGKTANESGGFLKSLIPITVILANLRIEISNVHVRCEDDSATQPGYSFAFGFTTQRIQLRAVNDLGQDTFISESADVSRRKADISNCSVYWDCDIHPHTNPLWGKEPTTDVERKNYDSELIEKMKVSIAIEDTFETFNQVRRQCFIVAPASAFCFVQINSNLQDFSVCRCSINCVVPTLKVHLRSKQFRDAKAILNYQVSMQKRISAAEILLRLQSWRPTVPKAKAWWKYALLSVIELIRSRSDLSYGDMKSSIWNWITLKNIGTDRRLYTELYAKRLRMSESKPKTQKIKKTGDDSNKSENTEEILENMSEADEVNLLLLEDRLPVGLIVLFRSMVHQDFLVEQVIREKSETKNSQGYFSWLFAGGTEETEIDLSEDQKQAIRKEADIISRLGSSTTPNDFELIHLEFQTNVECTLWDSHSKSGQQAIAASDVSVSLQFIQYAHCRATRLSFKHIRLSDLTESHSEPLTILSMYPSSEQSNVILELFIESWTVRSNRDLDLNVRLTVETTKFVLSGTFFRHFVHFLRADYTRSSLILLNGAFWEWTEMQQSFLMSAISKQKRRRLEAAIGVVNFILVAEDSRNVALALRSLTIFSEPNKTHDLAHMNLSHFQISIRLIEADDVFIILEPTTFEISLKLPSKELWNSTVDVSIPSISVDCDMERIRNLIQIISHFTSALSSVFTRQNKPITSSSLKKFAVFPAIPLMKSYPGASLKTYPSISNINIRCFVGIVNFTASFCLRLASLELSGSFSNWQVRSEGLRLYNQSNFRFGWIAQSQDDCQGENISLSIDSIGPNGPQIVFGIRNVDWQWTPFYIQSFLDFLADCTALLSELNLGSPPETPSKQSISRKSSYQFHVYLDSCTCLFNKRRRRLAIINIFNADIHYTHEPFNISCKFNRSAVLDASLASLRSLQPTDFIFADVFDIQVSSGEPFIHWAAVKVNAIGLKITYFHRVVQELIDYISNGLTGILFGFNPDKKEQWPDFSPELHGPFCAVNLDFPNVQIFLPACSSLSSIRRHQGLGLACRNINVCNSAFADNDGWRTAKWKVYLDSLVVKSLVEVPISGDVVVEFSTHPKCDRVPWLKILISLSSLDLYLNEEASIRSGWAAITQNLAEGWIEPQQFPCEHEYRWYLDDILSDIGSSIRVDLTLPYVKVHFSSAFLQLCNFNLLLNRNINWSIDLSIRTDKVDSALGNTNLVQTLPEGNIALRWSISGDFQQTQAEIDLYQVYLIVEPELFDYFISETSVNLNYNVFVLLSKRSETYISMQQLASSSCSDCLRPSFIEFVNLELDSESYLRIPVPAISKACIDLLLDSKFVRGFIDATTILRSCINWVFLGSDQLFDLLRDASTESLFAILRIMMEQTLSEMKTDGIIHDPFSLHEMTCKLKPQEFGFLVFMVSFRAKFLSPSLNSVFENEIANMLSDFWGRKMWPLHQQVNFYVDSLVAQEDLKFFWSSQFCPKHSLVLSELLEVQIPVVLFQVLNAVKEQHMDKSLSIGAHFLSSIAVFAAKFSTANVGMFNELLLDSIPTSEIIALFLYLLRIQHDPIIPFQLQRSSDVLKAATTIASLPQWSRHILLAIANFIYTFKADISDKEIICNIIGSALLWSEPVSLSTSVSTPSILLRFILNCLEVSNHQNDLSLIFNCSGRTLRNPKFEVYSHFHSFSVHLISPNAPAMLELVSSSQISLLRSDDKVCKISFSIDSMELFGHHSISANAFNKMQLLIFRDSFNNAENEFQLHYQYGAEVPTDLSVTIGHIAAFLCKEDYVRFSSLFAAFSNKVPVMSSNSQSDNANLALRIQLQSFSLAFCSESSTSDQRETRDPLLKINFGLHPILITSSQRGSIELCSFNALVHVDFLHPKVAVWEPVVEPFNLQFSWSRTGWLNGEERVRTKAIPPITFELSGSNLFNNISETNMTNTIQVYINDPIRFNLSPETVSCMFSLWSSTRAKATSTFNNSCAFTLRNLTGLSLKWACYNSDGVLEDMNSTSLECLGSNPWEPDYALSLTVGDHWLPISNAYVGNVGAFQFALMAIPPENDHRMPQDGLVLEALIENGHAVLCAHSSIGFFNCTSLQLQIILFNGDLQTAFDLNPLQTRWTPLLFCAWDSFCIGVVESADSVRQLGRLSVAALRRKRRSEHVFCVGGNRFVFLCASSGGLWPGRLAITVRAPLDIRNRLPYPIEIKFDNDVGLHIESGSKAQVETIDGNTDMHLYFTMQGFQWSSAIGVFDDKSNMDDGRRTTLSVPIQDRFGATLYVVVEITRIIAVDDNQRKFNGRALFRVTFYTRLWLLNQVPGVELLFGSSRGSILPGQNGRQIIDYVFENQRWYPGKGWSGKLFPGDHPSWSDIDGNSASLSSIQLPGPDWSWADSGWTVDTDPIETDDHGWAYAKNFSKTFHAENKKKYLVRRRRYSRARVLLANDSLALPVCMFSPGGRKQLTSRYSTSHICVKTKKSDWSDPINLLHGTDTRVLTLFTHDFGRILDLGIYISPSQPPFRDTWVASFMPRYIVWNSFPQARSNICVQQLSDAFNICIVHPGKQKAFFFNRIPFETEKSVRSTYVRVGAIFNELMFWSSGFDINCVGLHVLRVSNGEDHRIVQLQISLHKASVILYLGESDPLRPRYSIRNELSVPLIISQSQSPNNFFKRIEPKEFYSGFAWDLLSAKDRLLCMKIDDSRFLIDIDTIGAISSLGDSTFVCVFADSDTNVVLITSSETRAKRFVQAYNDSSSDSTSDCWLKVTVHIEEALFSFISTARTELMLAALLSVEVSLTHSAYLQHVELTLDSFRIDNQLYSEQNSLFAFPKVLFSESSHSHSFLWFQCTRSFHTSDMQYFKLLDLAIQPFIINLEETYVVTVLEFVRSIHEVFESNISTEPSAASDVDPISPSFSISKLMYFEVLRTPSIKMLLSVRKAQEALSHEYLRERIGLAHLLGVLLSNLEAKPIRRPGHEYLRLCDRANSVQEQLVADYKGSLLLEFLASFGYNKLALGGVVPILSTFRAGVRDFKKEIQSSLKQGNIRGGLTRGTFSLIDHTARGLMMPITGLSAGLGDVLSALTFDQDFTSRRALDVGNKPRHFIDGIVRGGRSFGLGIFNGVAALVREPIKHYRRHEGGVGIAVGIGKGMAQVVASPIVGVFDAINHIGTGIARTPDYFRRRSALVHASHHFRLPRAFYGPGRSIRVYDPVDALIVNCLQSSKPPIDATIHHVFIGGLMNDVRAYALLIRGIAAFQLSNDKYAIKLMWFIGWSGIQSFELIENGIKIFSVSGVTSKESSWLLMWLSQPSAAFEIILSTHARYKAALRVRSKGSLLMQGGESGIVKE